MAKTSKKLSKFNVNIEPRKYSQSSEGAIDLNYLVKGQMKDGSWVMAKIVDCRLSKNYDPKKKKTEYSYDYYVHYIDYDRRMDEWVPRNRLEITTYLVDEETYLRKKHHSDKEHEGILTSPHYF
jgi:RNA binding activity-knot of a chromodomain